MRFWFVLLLAGSVFVTALGSEMSPIAEEFKTVEEVEWIRIEYRLTAAVQRTIPHKPSLLPNFISLALDTGIAHDEPFRCRPIVIPFRILFDVWRI